MHGRPTRRRLERITLNLASMIDVTFLILIYFLLTSVLVRPEDRLTTALQTEQETGASASDFQPQVVEVIRHEGQPAYRVGERIMFERRDLATTLGGLPKSEGVFINVADDVPVGIAVTAMQEAYDAGFNQVTHVPQR